MSQALILCAGSSTRMGQPKALCSLGNQTLIERILTTLEQSSAQQPILATIVVAEPHGHAICRWLLESRFHSLRVVWNQRPSDGMLSSIQHGLRSLDERAMGTLLWPVDVPLVKEQTVRTLLQHAAQRWLVPTSEGRGGHPVWLPAALWSDVLALPVDSSLRALRDHHPALRIAVEDPEIICDIDTPEALKQADLRLRR